MVVAAPMRKESPEKRRSGVLLQHLNDLLLSRVAGHKYFVQQTAIIALPVPLPVRKGQVCRMLNTVSVTLSVATGTSTTKCPGEVVGAVPSSDVSVL